MDTRFPPIPKKVRVPLYPQKTRIDVAVLPNARMRLLQLLASELQCDTARIILASSASASLYIYLKATNGHGKSVALPAFNCPSLARAIVMAGCQPVFTDIDANSSITMKSIQFAIEQKCQYFVWPNYFGMREHSLTMMNALRKAGILIIFDEAQSFPVLAGERDYTDLSYADAVLLSFGTSKPLAGDGGGALYLPNGTEKLHNKISRMVRVTDMSSQYTERFKEAIINRLVLSFPRFVYKLGVKSLPYSNLDSLLNVTAKKWDTNLSMSKYVAKTSYKHLVTINNGLKSFEAHYAILSDKVKDLFGDNSLQLVDRVRGVPSILAIKIPKDERYSFLDFCSRNDIQVTWYYYPLSLLRAYKSSVAEPLNSTNQISESIVVLPFQWLHSNKQFKIIIRALSNYPETTK